MTKQDKNLLTQAVLQDDETAGVGPVQRGSLPVGYIPTPTREYRSYRKSKKATVGAGIPISPLPIPVPQPLIQGSRVLMWKPDPSVAELGIRKDYLPSIVLAGPKDSRIAITGLPPVSPNALGDLIQTPGTDEFDSVHTFAVVRETLTMYQRALNSLGSPSVLPWQ